MNSTRTFTGSGAYDETAKQAQLSIDMSGLAASLPTARTESGLDQPPPRPIPAGPPRKGHGGPRLV